MSAKPAHVIVRIEGRDELFESFEALDTRARRAEHDIRELERTRLALNPRDGLAWAAVAAHVATLQQLLPAMQAWLDAEDAELERARALIRKLGMDEDEQG